MSPTTAVFDAGVVLQATLNPDGPGGQSLRLMDSGIIKTYHSPHTRDEVVDILYRPGLRRKYGRLTDSAAEIMLWRLDTYAKMIPHVFRSLPYPRDPKDKPIINLAIQEKADYLVTRDRDLLDLADSRDFRLLYPFLRIVTPQDFLDAIAAAEPEAPEIEAKNS